uniref:hypothetical protein n=1 Tax=Streptomyces sp. S501 TaxID=2420135 RepID=UPI001F112E38|nr:hypothetical protein [Streptomyces sp. S501]
MYRRTITSNCRGELAECREEPDAAVHQGDLLAEAHQRLRYDDPAHDRPGLLLEIAFRQKGVPVSQDLVEDSVDGFLGCVIGAEVEQGVAVVRLLVGDVMRLELQREGQYGVGDRTVAVRANVFGHE